MDDRLITDAAAASTALTNIARGLHALQARLKGGKSDVSVGQRIDAIYEHLIALAEATAHIPELTGGLAKNLVRTDGRVDRIATAVGAQADLIADLQRQVQALEGRVEALEGQGYA